ncbi:MAG: hypothetical protein LUQ50_02890 [Methanospirillum sp.]|uniref:alpha/beta hydrolase n=1 Tax=Methanospirillum sp. TaxID=45200 RepID=UPI0023692E85|nr:hypothetical protein [Methanospirillum sp.]MDD1728000.1 hypothetical protein [Methanospirillum sp.]
MTRKTSKEKRLEPEFVNVDDVPVAFCRPDESVANGSLAVWLPYLGGNKETGIRELQQLAASGYFAISLDPWQHGDRKGTTTSSLRTRVFKEFRANMWPVLGITTLDTYRVIDWAIATYNLSGDVVAGGVSMGGDIAIALAGIDQRITRVAAIASTPEWTRPGMTDVMDPKKIIDQGIPTHLGEWLYKTLNPMTNRSAYSRAPAMHLEFGATDTHVSPQCALAFKEALEKECPAAAQAITIILNDGCNHLSLIQKHSIAKRAVEFLIG